MTRMTGEELAAIARRVEVGHYHWTTNCIHDRESSCDLCTDCARNWFIRADAARSDVPALLAEVAELRRERDEARAVVESARYLANEVTGVLGIAFQEIRDAVGNANVSALMLRRDEVRAAIEATARTM